MNNANNFRNIKLLSVDGSSLGFLTLDGEGRFALTADPQTAQQWTASAAEGVARTAVVQLGTGLAEPVDTVR
jgi:hypothetical protein